MKKDKKTLVISTVAIVLLIMIVIGATYAYFKAQTGVGGNVPTQVTTNTTDSLVFETGANITLTADMSNFTEGMDNRTGTSFARATLKANNKTNSATGNYYVYFEVTKNELSYTTETKKPELLLKITKTLGNNTPEEVTTGIEGVEYKTVTDGKGNTINGYDITEYSGLLTIANNKEITATSETVEKYDIEVILVNLDDDQTANGGKSFAGSLKIQKEKLTLADVCKNQEFGSCISRYSQLDNNIYHHTASLANSAEDGSYRYAGSSYGLTSKALANNYNSVTGYSSVNGVVKYYCSDSSYHKFGSCYSEDNYYYLDYDESKIKYDLYLDAVNQAIKDGYVDLIVNNYVCFGTNADTCDNEHLYRIIGVFDNQIKLIMANVANESQLLPSYESKIDYYDYWLGSFYRVYEFDGIPGDTWADSLVNTKALNTTFINYLGTTWSDKIAMANWKIGGNTEGNLMNQNPSTVYKNEIVNPTEGTIYSAKIGLMYISDFSYCISPSYWGLAVGSEEYYNAVESNWIPNADSDTGWTITKFSDSNKAVYVYGNSIDSIDTIGGNTAGEYILPVRPTFYLNTDVKMTGGSGTFSDPYRVN